MLSPGDLCVVRDMDPFLPNRRVILRNVRGRVRECRSDESVDRVRRVSFIESSSLDLEEGV